MTFPRPDAESLFKFYGQPYRVTSDGLILDETFEAANITRITAPYDMWMGETKITRIAINKKCVESLTRVLNRISKEITPDERKRFGLDQYGGGYNFRSIRGADGKLTVNKLSLHSYGAAIDLAPQLNPLGKFYQPEKLMMPHEVIEMFKREGWAWGGDFKVRPDCMHFQATS